MKSRPILLYAGTKGLFMNNKLLRIGIIGSVVAALCCFTPVLVLLLGAFGLSAMVGYVDLVLLPALAVFVMITLYAVWRGRTGSA